MIVDRFWFLQLSNCHKRRQNIFGCDPATTDTFCCCIHLVTVCVSVWDPYSMHIWKAPEICGLGISTFCCCWLAKQNRIGITSNHISWPKSQRIFVLNVSLSNMYFHVTSSLWNWLENTEIQILFCCRRRKKVKELSFCFVSQICLAAPCILIFFFVREYQLCTRGICPYRENWSWPVLDCVYALVACERTTATIVLAALTLQFMGTWLHSLTTK